MACCGTKDVMLLACSGACNVGQLTNDAARTLDSLGQGRMFCAIGVAAKTPSFVEAAAKARLRVAIDGCDVACVRKALESAGLEADGQVVVTELGFEKAHRLDYTQADVARVGEAVLASLAGR